MTARKNATWTIVTFTVIGLLLTLATSGQLSPAQIIHTNGTIIAPNMSGITVTPSNIIGTNNLALGAQFTYGDLEYFHSDSQGQALMQNSGIKLVRIGDNNLDDIGTPLVLSWNETTHTGTFNWTVIDPVIQAIYASGAQPIIVLMGNMAGAALSNTTQFTNGMKGDPASDGLPFPADAASYAAAWVTHMQTMGYPVIYYEISNEIQNYLGDGGWPIIPFSGSNLIRMGDFATVYNTTVTAMKEVNPALSASFDFSWFGSVINWWVTNYTGTPLDRIDFHNYATNYIGEYSNDSGLLQAAQSITTGNTGYGTGFWSGSNPVLAQETYYNAKAVTLPLFDTESNLDSQWSPNTDPKIVQMVGAVFAALLLKTEILENVEAHIYFDWDASLSYHQSLSPPSYGFGLIDGDNHQPWYPYYVYQMIGNNLQVGDSIVSSTNSGNVSSFAWIDKGNLNILLINTANSTVSITVSGASGNFNYKKIDNTYSFLNAQPQTGTLSLPSSITMNGYTVILLTSTPTPPA